MTAKERMSLNDNMQVYPPWAKEDKPWLLTLKNLSIASGKKRE